MFIEVLPIVAQNWGKKKKKLCLSVYKQTMFNISVQWNAAT